MHAIKGGWVGQTFALAKCNQSEGRKTRIRRSKEERKTMVEAFIKKYQRSNNGKFPSLNLTHKEVGGSFYTVREMVRDIIQENRVLGPGKLTLEALNSNQVLELDSLGSIPTEPQTPATTSLRSETHFVPNYNQSTNDEPILVSDLDGTEPEDHHFETGISVNGTQVDLKESKSSELELIHSESQVNGSVEEEKNVEEELGASRAIAANVVVETFPLRSITGINDRLDGRLGKARGVFDSLEEKEIKKLELGADAGGFEMKGSDIVKNSGRLDEKAATNLASSSLGIDPDLVKEEIPKKHGDHLVENLNGSVLEEGNKPEIQNTGDLAVEVTCTVTLTSQTVEQGEESAELKVKAPDGVDAENLYEKSKTKEKAENENRANVQHNGGSSKESNPTLNRISLESWDGVSKSSAKSENNPLLAIFKALVAAFVKFWSE